MLQTTQVLQERYQLQKQLGNNAGRQTWLAIDLKASPPEPVTVKLLAFSPQMQWDEFKLFEREASVLKNLNHPRIPNYRDYFSLDKQMGAGLCWFGLVQDYIPGASLQQLLDKGKRFTEAQVRSIATQVLKILTYLHRLNPPVLHRDIKPSNLILGEDKQVYLVDFGAVQDTAAVEGVTFTVVGTTGYAPLEQFWGKAVEASDLYALGATLIHLLTGIPPADLPQRNLRIQFKDQVSINSSFVNWIEALTEPDLSLRLSTVNEALDALQTGRFLSHPLETLTPPFNSCIQFQKSPNKLNIIIPRRRRFILWFPIKITWKAIPFLSLSIMLILISLSIIWIVFLLAILLLEFAFSLENVTAIASAFVSIFILICLWMEGRQNFFKITNDLINHTLFALCFHSLLEIDTNKFVIEFSQLGLWNIHYRGQTSDIKSIWRDNHGSKVYLKAGAKTYCLANHLTKSESNWLVQEIQDWFTQL